MAQNTSHPNILTTSLYALIVIFIIFIFTLILFLEGTTHFLNISFSELILQLKNNLFLPNENNCFVGKISSQSVLSLFYRFLLLTIVILTVGHAIIIRCQKPKYHFLLSQAIPLIFMMTILLFSGIQQYARYDYLQNEKIKFGKKSLDEKYSILFESLYKFAHMNQKLLENYHQGQLISDLDFRKDPATFFHRILSYHFYPKVSLRLDNKTPNDIVILFHKKNPLVHIPKGYKIFSATQNRDYILAIKETSQP